MINRKFEIQRLTADPTYQRHAATPAMTKGSRRRQRSQNSKGKKLKSESTIKKGPVHEGPIPKRA